MTSSLSLSPDSSRSQTQLKFPVSTRGSIRSTTLASWMSLGDGSRCKVCLQLNKNWKTLQAAPKALSQSQISKLQELFDEVLRHQRRHPNCGGCTHRLFLEISDRFKRYEQVYNELVNQARGSYFRVLCQNAPTPFSPQHLAGYSPLHFLEDTLFIINRVLAQRAHPRLADLHRYVVYAVEIHHWVRHFHQQSPTFASQTAPSSPASPKSPKWSAFEWHLEKILEKDPQQMVWIPIVTRVPESGTLHLVILSLRLLGEKKASLTLVNIGYRALTDSARHVRDLVIETLVDEAFYTKLANLSLTFRTTQDLYHALLSLWPHSCLGQARRPIWRPLCATQTWRRLYRDLLGGELYEQFMQAWTLYEIERLEQTHELLEQLPQEPQNYPRATLGLAPCTGSLYSTKKDPFSIGQALDERGYQQHLQGLALSYLERCSLASRAMRSISHDELPPVVRRVLLGEKPPVEDEPKVDGEGWQLVVRRHR